MKRTVDVSTKLTRDPYSNLQPRNSNQIPEFYKHLNENIEFRVTRMSVQRPKK